MKNQEISEIFHEISQYLEMDNVSFKPYAYRRASFVLDSLEEDVGEIYNKKGLKGLEEISGIGKSMALLIEEYIKKGKINYYSQVKKKVPVDIKELSRIEGIGPKTIKSLYQELGIKNIKDLEKAAKSHKISSLFNFDKKTEENILEGIAFLKESKDKFFLGEILPEAKNLKKEISLIKDVLKIEMAGSLRRMKEVIGDVDFLVISKDSKKIIEFFNKNQNVLKIVVKRKTKISVKMKGGYNVDLRIVPDESYGAALQYFTGSKDHNISLRKIAIKKGLKINEYGIFKKDSKIGGRNEEEMYNLLGLKFISPELRENRGEIEASLNNKLPQLINQKDIRGDIHCHSTWSGGENSIKEMAEKAMEMGYDYIGIADHTQFLRIENGLNEKELKEQRKEIDKLNLNFKKQGLKFKILQGCEANILKNGLLDIKDEALKELDFVIAGVHSNFKMEKEEMTKRIIKTMENPHIDIISHPTGRILGKRKEYEVDFEKILKKAKETKTVLEINAYPQRMDLNDLNIYRAKKAGVKMVINTDSHHKNQMNFMEFGISQARRGWAEKKDIINSKKEIGL